MPEVNGIEYLNPLGFIGQPGFAACGLFRKNQVDYPFLYIRSFSEGLGEFSKFIYSDNLLGEWLAISLGSSGQPILAGLGYSGQQYSNVTQIGVYDTRIGMVAQSIESEWYVETGTVSSYRYPLAVFSHQNNDYFVYLTPAVSIELNPMYGLHATLWQYCRNNLNNPLVFCDEAIAFFSIPGYYPGRSEIEPFALVPTEDFAGDGDMLFIASAGVNVGEQNEYSELLYGILNVELENDPSITFNTVQTGTLAVPNQETNAGVHRAFLGNDFEFTAPVTASPLSFEGIGCGVSYIDRDLGVHEDKRIWLFELSSADVLTNNSQKSMQQGPGSIIDQGFSLLSNPANRCFEVSIDESASPNTQFELYDLYGRLISRINATEPGVYELPESWHDPLPVGVYIIRMSTEEGINYVMRCIIQ